MDTKNHFVNFEKEKFLVYGYIMLGAFQRNYKIENISSERIYFPMCYLHSYDDNGIVRTFLPLAFLLTRCSQPRLDILYVDMDAELIRQAKEGKDAPYTIIRYSEPKKNESWLRFVNKHIAYYNSSIVSSCYFKDFMERSQG